MYESTPPSPCVGVPIQKMALVAVAVAVAALVASVAAFVVPSSYEHVRGRWRPSMCAGGRGGPRVGFACVFHAWPRSLLWTSGINVHLPSRIFLDFLKLRGRGPKT